MEIRIGEPRQFGCKIDRVTSPALPVLRQNAVHLPENIEEARSCPKSQNLIGFALIALGMVLTPGPNMIYLISRSICQGPAAGLISLGGVGARLRLVYMVSAALGITALLLGGAFCL